MTHIDADEASELRHRLHQEIAARVKFERQVEEERRAHAAKLAKLSHALRKIAKKGVLIGNNCSCRELADQALTDIGDHERFT